jgi:hypothetical protein
MMRELPNNFLYWPDDGVEERQPDEVVKMYEAGYAGVWKDDAAQTDFIQEIESAGGYSQASAALSQYGLQDSAAGKLVTPFQVVEQMWPGCWPASAQTRGDCVSHSSRNACLVTMSCEIAAGQPDPDTGIIEGPPEVSESGRRDGVLSSESNYWWRGHGGDGWHCGHAVQVLMRSSGCCWPRKAYPDIDVDLSSYSGSTAGKWGRSSPPESVKSIGTKHLIRTATECRSFEEVRDLLGNGYGITTCGGEGFSSSRDENGVSSRRGSWAHAMAYIGADDRDEVKQKYGGPLVLVLNSWGRWNSGPRRILGTDIDIPEGSFWARWKDVSRRETIAVSNLNGWPGRKINNLLI